MFVQARKILNSLEDAQHRVDDVDSTSSGSVTIGVLPTLASFILPSTLKKLYAKFPHAMVIVREEISESLVDAAASGELGILIEVLPFDQTHLHVEPLFIDEFYVAVHQDNPLSRLEEIPII